MSSLRPHLAAPRNKRINKKGERGREKGERRETEGGERAEREREREGGEKGRKKLCAKIKGKRRNRENQEYLFIFLIYFIRI